MVLEFPGDPHCYDNSTGHQLMSGPAFLVAPVYENTTTRDGIYLPEEEWVDYWTGERHQGPKVLNNYSAPLDILPVLVRAGALIPMWSARNYWNEKVNC